MREFLLLPVGIVGAVVLLPIAAVTVLVIGGVMWIGEKEGWARIGGIHQDRYLEDLDHDPFPPGELARLRRLNGIDPEE